ncbi:sugar-binding transcriptional regulator [Staphylococcus epidermidis]|uniref:sugar-binding transcriptional regulator n=1 Tax=Staphylococcus epidermidis TaxID=1282 RepID=UPI0011A2DE94|nr:sugar-binding transcriptional regulator [Staphylococcus epidermidis]MBU5628415.1 sugar-binding transcriptional regulator [Staphylococcus epidermidis]MCG1918481.1 sugar-binding transcriptional regulator [Staphylococcus epidermidis]MCG2376558.1 sugar-binding transcriptional regulator [Staphylococcus epidermidis]MCG2379355.1 sugar-binding transcriptional regulator [Staphylococcus epidermidis]MDK8127368.1 sugar-binding transcriptional regulator [Staphylococcus epidermidis]
MKDLIKVQQKLIPDLIDKMYRRFYILSTISQNQPVGRRSLSEHMDMTERVLRSETDMLKKQELIRVKPTGMEITNEGTEVLAQLGEYFNVYSDDHKLASAIKDKFHIKDVHVIPGDSDSNRTVKREMGQQAGQLLEGILYEDAIVSVTGGSTMACVSESIHLLPFNVFFVPARGGLGENVVYQANTIASSMAQQAGGYYTTLYVPDNVSESTYDTLMLEPSVMHTLDKIKQANITIHGIGDALKMAHQRQSSQNVIDNLQHHQAVGEAFGYYFDAQGQIVHKVKTIGLQLEDLENKDFIFAVAGGQSKGEAIKAYLSIAPENTVLITDEAAAKVILQ